MKGTIVKREKGDWVIWWTDPTTENGLHLLPLIGEGFEDGSEVEFEIVLCIPDDLMPTSGETVSFTAIKKAKLI